MTDKILIINFEEIYLKGKNQRIFIKQLVRNLKRKLSDYTDYLSFTKSYGGSYFIEIIKEVPDEILQSLIDKVKNTPGISGLYVADTSGISIDEIIDKSLEHLSVYKDTFESFAVVAKRINKSVSYDSMELARKTGAAINRHFDKKVDLTRPDIKIYIKVRGKYAIIYSKIIKGLGGLPVGTSGKAVAMLSGGIDSPVATFMAMNRGLHITAVHFHSVPKTSPQSIEKVKMLAKKLTAYQGQMKLYLIPVLTIQEAIAKHTDSRLRLILLRRIMLKAGEKIALKEKAKVLVTGDSLGQVASQTLENMKATEAATDMFVIRPLVALDKKFIIEKAKEIETYDISILPHDDACALFTPKSPETKAQLKYVEEQCAKIPVDDLIEQALSEAVELIINDKMSSNEKLLD
jgi:thiamine biosynthesis protein ThiI